MPVYCLEGVGGCGKTLFLIKNYIIPWLKAGKPIYHNIEGLKVPFIALRAGVPFGVADSLITEIGFRLEEVDGEMVVKDDYDEIREFYNDSLGKVRPPGSLILIDEAQNAFNSRDFKETYSRALIDYISRNRHYKHTIVWTSQNVDGVDITFRRQTQYIYFLERVGDKPFSTCNVYESWCKNEYTKPYDKYKFNFPQELFGTFDSYVKGTEGEEEHREKTNRWLHSKPLMIVIILFVIFVVWAIFHNPISTIKKQATPKKSVGLVRSSSSVPQDTATPPALNGRKAEGAAAVALPSFLSSVCWKRFYRADGIEYFVLSNGRTVEADWDKYGECEE